RLPAQVPPRLEQLPCDLKRDGSLARAGCECQQNAVAVLSDALKHTLDRNFLVVADLPAAALIWVRHGREAVAPRVLLGEGLIPQLFGARESGDLTFLPFEHVDAVRCGGRWMSTRSGWRACRRNF